MKFNLLLLLLTVTPVWAQSAAPATTSPSLLASAVIAAVVSAAVSGLIALMVKDKEYKNEYYKKVIDKRLKAIEALEACTYLFTARNYATDGSKTWHVYFEKSINSDAYTEAVSNMSKYSIWYGMQTIKRLDDFTACITNLLAQCKGKEEKEAVNIGVNNYEKIEYYRLSLEASIRSDMASLHKVEKFFKSMPMPPINLNDD
jgi:hypothetical protein